ncbi:phosphatases II, partial [Amniculicola lignicola CBS 123094]
ISEIRAKFQDLEWEQRTRLMDAARAEPYDLSEDTVRWSFPSEEQMANRNWYPPVRPFEFNRVILRVSKGKNDYINASKMKITPGYRKWNDDYIASQAPKDSTVAHFWNMIRFDGNKAGFDPIIIMLTSSSERNREDRECYFPTSTTEIFESTDDSGVGYRVFAEPEAKEYQNEHYTWRNLNLVTTVLDDDVPVEPTVTKSKVTHVHFHGWPDSGVPEGGARENLLKLIRTARDLGTPTVVHCTAGVSRTGVYIALDSILAYFDKYQFLDVRDDEDPVVDVVRDLRRQRMMMVQSEQQFAFLYDVLREVWWKKEGEGRIVE